MNKPNANKIKTLEIKLVLWLAPLLALKENRDVDSNLIVAKMVTSNEGKGGQEQEAQLA